MRLNARILNVFSILGPCFLLCLRFSGQLAASERCSFFQVDIVLCGNEYTEDMSEIFLPSSFAFFLSSGLVSFVIVCVNLCLGDPSFHSRGMWFPTCRSCSRCVLCGCRCSGRNFFSLSLSRPLRSNSVCN